MIDGEKCYHCGLNALPEITAKLDDKNVYFCCYGCQAVAQTIYQKGFSSFYQFRSRLNLRPEEKKDFSPYDNLDIQAEFTDVINETDRTSDLLIGGITCAACVWLLENQLSQVPGIKDVLVNSTARTAKIVWEKQTIKLSAIFDAIAQIGYEPKPNTPSVQQGELHSERKKLLIRLGVAGFGMMQAGMVAVALHAGGIQGMEPHWRSFLRWVSFILITPVIIYAASPFYFSAWRALKNYSLNMDVSVSIALLVAYVSSTYATLYAHGEVYFDSIGMFTFFLLLARFLEFRLRLKNIDALNAGSHILPLYVQRYDEASFENIARKKVRVGDRIRVLPGEVFPVDGEVIEGTSSVNESLINGESTPQNKTPGASVFAGSINGESPLSIRTTATGQQTQLAAIENWASEASKNKPQVQLLSDKLASYFVACVILIAATTYITWFNIDSSKALWVALSVLVVTCPCALSLATPTVFTAALAWARKRLILFKSAQYFSQLEDITDVAFDKTGTLTQGELCVEKVLPLADIDEKQIMLLCATLEKNSHHPIAKAFQTNTDISIPDAAIKVIPGKGVCATIDQDFYSLGSPSLIPELQLQYPDAGQWILLTKNHDAIAWIKLSDNIRAEANETISALKRNNITSHILSGDREENVSRLANTLQISHWHSALSAEEKYEAVKKLQSENKRVLMVGDGINDAPVLKVANTSIAMSHASQLAHTQADAVFLKNNLALIPSLIKQAKIVKQKIRQNITWAICYNLLALPLAVLGYVPPWMAAIGMSASSLVVVANAARIAK